MNDPMEINKPAKKSKLLTSLQKNRSYLISLVLSILVALIIGGILMAVTGYNPFEAYAAMIKGVFGSTRVFGNTLAKMITLCLTGLLSLIHISEPTRQAEISYAVFCLKKKNNNKNKKTKNRDTIKDKRHQSH